MRCSARMAAKEPASELRTDALHLGAAGAITAAAVLSQWATLASRYVEDVGRVARELGAGSTTTQAAAGTVADAVVAYARDVADLPRLSSLRFYNELARLKGRAAPRARREPPAPRARRTSRSPR